MIQQLLDNILLESSHNDLNIYTIYESLADAIANNTIRAIMRNGVAVGFFSWKVLYKNSQQYVYMENLVIKRQYRKSDNLLFIRRIMRNLYPNALFYFHNGKRNMWAYYK